MSLSTGQSLTIGTAGIDQLTYNGPGSGSLVVVLNQQQYYGLVQSGVGTYTDISNPKLNMLHIAIPAAAGTFVQGEFSYCGYSFSAAAAASCILQDAAGGGTQVTGSVAVPIPVDYLTLGGAGSLSTFYQPNPVPGAGALQSSIPITPGSNGGLAVASPSGTYTGVVRIAGE